jgi:hypothetical protein
MNCSSSPCATYRVEIWRHKPETRRLRRLLGRRTRATLMHRFWPAAFSMDKQLNSVDEFRFEPPSAWRDLEL